MSAMELLENRMKQYEASSSLFLPPRLPYIIRINYHSISSLKSILSQETINEIFQYIANDMSKNIQGCILSHRNHDEISFVILNNKNTNTQSWLGGDVNNIVSITSSMATAFFIRALSDLKIEMDDKIPIFKSKVFVVQDMNEVYNYFIWRDSIKNKLSQSNILIIKDDNKWIPIYFQSSSNDSMLDLINNIYNTYIKGASDVN